MTTEQGALRTSLGPGTLFVNRPALLLPELGEPQGAQVSSAQQAEQSDALASANSARPQGVPLGHPSPAPGPRG